jgi:hypothetical protein
MQIAERVCAAIAEISNPGHYGFLGQDKLIDALPAPSQRTSTWLDVE